MQGPVIFQALILSFLLWFSRTVKTTYVIQLSTDGSYGSDNERLFLENGNTTISCLLSGGTPLATPSEPTMTLWNASWYKQFTFETTEDASEWQLIITRTSILLGDPLEELLPKQPWRLRVDLEVDGEPVSTEVSLLDKIADPLMFWTIGTELGSAPSLSEPITRIHHSPCLPDTAMYAYKTQASAGFYLVLTHASFHSGTFKWYQLSFSEVCGTDCLASDELLDILLTNHRLMILTTAGLHVSNDIRVYNISSSNTMTFSTLFATRSYVANPANSLLSFAGPCAWRQYDAFPSAGDLISITVTASDGTSGMWYSRDPFSAWHEATSNLPSLVILDGVYNLHMETMGLLVKNTTDNLIYCELMKMNDDMSLSTRDYVRPFPFDSTSALTRLRYISHYSVFYATGSETWISEDGGNTFEMINSFDADVIGLTVDTHTNTVVMMCDNGTLLYGKYGVPRLSALTTTFTLATSSAHFDALGNLMIVDASTGTPSVAIVDPTNEVKTSVTSFLRPLSPIFLSHKKALVFEHKGVGVSGSVSSMFSSRNVGQQINVLDGGTGLIEEYKNENYTVDFLSVIKIRITSPWLREASTAVIQKHTLGVVYLDPDIGTAVLYLDSYQSGTGWSDNEISKTVVIPGHTSFLITSIINVTHVEAVAVIYARSVGLHPPRAWFVINLGTSSGSPAWSLQEPSCPYTLQPSGDKSWVSEFELDLHDSVENGITVCNAESGAQKKPPEPYVALSNPWLFNADFKRHYNYHTICHQLNVTLKSYTMRRGMVGLRFVVPVASLLCDKASHSLLVYSGCPCQKRLKFAYAYNLTNDEFLNTSPTDNSSSAILFTLPVNYRPPSKLGVGIPTSRFIYNADPSKERPFNSFTVSKSSGVLNRCLGAASAAECGCTDFMRLSPHPDNTDCRNKVYRVLHPVIMKTPFLIEQYGREDMKMPDDFLIRLEEINDRAPGVTGMEVSKDSLSLYDKMVNNPLFPNWSEYFVPNHLQIVMNGSGLYHYKVEVIGGVSLCKLTVYFQLYVDQVPIAYPLQYILNFGTALIFGGVFFGLYLWYFFNHHTHRVRRVGSQCLESDIIY